MMNTPLFAIETTLFNLFCLCLQSHLILLKYLWEFYTYV